MYHFQMQFGILFLIGVLAARVTNSSPAFRPFQIPLERFISEAEDLTRKEELSAAEQVYLRALQHFPGDKELKKRLGILYQTQLRFRESLKIFESILVDEPAYAEVNFYLGLSYLGMNLYDQAVESFQRELKLYPKYRRTRYYLAVAFQALRQPVKALEQLHILNEEDPNDPKALYELARTHQALSLQALNRLSRVAPDSDLFLALQAEAHAKGEKYVDAIKVYQDLRQKNPRFPGIHFGLGEIYWKTLRVKEAESELRRALEDDPNHPLANYYLADILLRNQKADEALPLLQIAVAADPSFAPAHFQLGKCYAAKRMWKEALTSFLSAARLDPNSKMTQYQLARVYVQLGDFERQKHHLQIFEQLEQQDKERTLKEAERLQLHSIDAQIR